jgi:hypothetical protein
LPILENLFQGLTRRLLPASIRSRIGRSDSENNHPRGVGGNDAIANARNRRLQQIARFSCFPFAPLQIFNQPLAVARSLPDGDRGKNEERENGCAPKQC